VFSKEGTFLVQTQGANMKLQRIVQSVLLLALLVPFAALGADDTPKDAKKAPAKATNMPQRIAAPKIDRKMAAAEAMRLFDKDGDGKLSGEELDKCPGLKAAINEVAPNGNGEITAADIMARIKAWQDSKLAIMSVACVVRHNGKPLVGAVVRFVPEKFLGNDIKPGTGKTDKTGIALLSIPAVGPRPWSGMAPGFYRVEITKDGDEIPAQYNSETTLGHEIARDADGIQNMRGIKFDLKY
jgi:hypothetical protein